MFYYKRSLKFREVLNVQHEAILSTVVRVLQRENIGLLITDLEI
jgi:hypothetical protein